jgi:adenosylcobinamide-GDP ribazoletransferase
LFRVLALLSRMRLSGSSVDLEAAAKRQYLFPAAGAVLGLIFCVAALVAFEFLGETLDALLIALLVVIFTYFLTGLIHLEGLADLGDGLMASGDKERKRGAMKDASLGASGAFFMIVAVLTLLLLVGDLGRWIDAPLLLVWADRVPLTIGLVIAEVSAKLAMNTVMVIGPSSHQGMGSVFVRAATPGKYAMALLIGFAIALLLSGIIGIIVLLGPTAGIIVALISKKHFGGVGGDAFGAANEFGRLLTLFAWVVLL